MNITSKYIKYFLIDFDHSFFMKRKKTIVLVFNLYIYIYIYIYI